MCALQAIANIMYIGLFLWIILGTEGVGVNWYLAMYLPIFALIASGCLYFLNKSGNLKSFMV